jgi:hypothetical protein
MTKKQLAKSRDNPEKRKKIFANCATGKRLISILHKGLKI